MVTFLRKCLDPQNSAPQPPRRRHSRPLGGLQTPPPAHFQSPTQISRNPRKPFKTNVTGQFQSPTFPSFFLLLPPYRLTLPRPGYPRALAFAGGECLG